MLPGTWSYFLCWGEVKGHVHYLQLEHQGGLMVQRRLPHRGTNIQQERRELSCLNVRLQCHPLFAITLEAKLGALRAFSLPAVNQCPLVLRPHSEPLVASLPMWFAKMPSTPRLADLSSLLLPRELAFLPLVHLCKGPMATWLTSSSQRVGLTAIGLMRNGSISSFHPRYLPLRASIFFFLHYPGEKQ